MQLVGRAVIAFLLCIMAVYLVMPNFIDSQVLLSKKKVNLGLDLQGGTYLSLQVDFKEHLKERFYSLSDDLATFLRKNKISYDKLYVSQDGVALFLNNPEDYVSVKSFGGRNISVSGVYSHLLISFNESYVKQLLKDVVSNSIQGIQKRLDRSGTKEITIKRRGDDRISLQVPGVHNVDSVKSLVGKTAKLTFHLLEDVKNLTDIDPMNTKLLRDAAGNTYPVIKKAEISGDSLIDASAKLNNFGKAVVHFKFNSAATKKFAEITRQNTGKPFAAVMDDMVLTAPVIREPILGGDGEISGRFGLSEAKELAILLKSGALPAPLHVVEERVIGPSLGAQSISSGRVAVILSVVAVSLFIIASYGILGVFAVVGLIFNIIFTLLIMTLIGATLTLPGIAGITLTVGMSIDANVLIFERIREELKATKKLMLAVDRGFKNAMSTIFDSNITTLLAALIMFVMGSASVSGFAVTLGAGILCSMLSAVMLTKVLIDLGVHTGMVRNFRI